MTYLAHDQCGTSAHSATAGDTLEWRSRYDGLVAIAHIGDKAVAGISGPWSGKFALTWWERPLPARQLELYDSMDDAKREVEDWAQRMHTGGCSIASSNPAPCCEMRAVPARPQPLMHRGLLERVRTLLPQFPRSKSPRPSSETIERLRRTHAGSETDISDLHFAAIK